MKKTKKRKKPLVATEYKYRGRESGKWWEGFCTATSHPNNFHGTSFATAAVTPIRHDVDEKLVEVVECRCRALAPRRKRTR